MDTKKNINLEKEVECPYSVLQEGGGDREFPVELRKIRRKEGLTKKTDGGGDEFDKLVKDLMDNASPKEQQSEKPDPEKLLVDLDGEDIVAQLKALGDIKRIIFKNEDKASFEILISGDLISKCIKLIKFTDHPQVASEAVIVLHLISYNDTNLTKVILHAEDAFPLFLDLLKTSLTLAEKSVLTLGNIAADSIECRNYLLKNGIIEALEHLSGQYQPKVFQRNFAWLLSNLCRSKGLTPYFNEAKRLIPLIKKILQESKDEDTWVHCCAALQRLSYDGDLEKIQAIVDSEVVKPLVRMVNINYPKVLPVALKVFGNISSGTAEHSKLIIDQKLLPKLATLLQYDNKETMQLALWIIGNLCADNAKNIQALIDSQIFTFFYPLMVDGSPQVQLEAAQTIKNVIKNGTKKQMNDILESNTLLGPFCRLLTSSNNDIVKIICDGLYDLLSKAQSAKALKDLCDFVERSNGTETLENLQYHENQTIREKSMRLVDKFFA